MWSKKNDDKLNIRLKYSDIFLLKTGQRNKQNAQKREEKIQEYAKNVNLKKEIIDKSKGGGKIQLN